MMQYSPASAEHDTEQTENNMYYVIDQQGLIKANFTSLEAATIYANNRCPIGEVWTIETDVTI